MKKQVARHQQAKARRAVAQKPHPRRGPAVSPATSAKARGIKDLSANRAAGKPSPAAPMHSPKPPAINKQQQYYDEAVRVFQSQKFERADALFQKVLEGPNRTLAHHAQVHSQICQKRLRPPEVRLKTADDHYNYAVTLLNERRLEEAARHLETALHMAPRADHLHYALAATQALQGNPQGAYERLKTAIALQPRNRALARGDSDFIGILEYPPVALLLQIERAWPPKLR